MSLTIWRKVNSMSTKYHVSSSGEAAVCTATVRACPLGGQHFDSLEQAQFAADLKSKGQPPKRVITPTVTTFPRVDEPKFIENQAHLWLEHDGSLGNIYGKPEARAAYIEGFRDGITGKSAAAETFPERNPDDLTARAREIGVRRGILTSRASEKDFLTQSFRAYSEGVSGHENYTVRFSNGSKQTVKPNAQREIYVHALHNPFKKNDKVVIPAGTPYSSLEGNGVTKRKVTIDVSSVHTSYSDGSVGKRSFSAAAVTAYSGKSYNLTPEIISMNGKPVYETPVMGMASMSKEMYYDDWDK